jgi:hypothetical protein
VLHQAEGVAMNIFWKFMEVIVGLISLIFGTLAVIAMSVVMFTTAGLALLIVYAMIVTLIRIIT